MTDDKTINDGMARNLSDEVVARTNRYLPQDKEQVLRKVSKNLEAAADKQAELNDELGVPE